MIVACLSYTVQQPWLATGTAPPLAFSSLLVLLPVGCLCVNEAIDFRPGPSAQQSSSPHDPGSAVQCAQLARTLPRSVQVRWQRADAVAAQNRGHRLTLHARWFSLRRTASILPRRPVLRTSAARDGMGGDAWLRAAEVLAAQLLTDSNRRRVQEAMANIISSPDSERVMHAAASLASSFLERQRGAQAQNQGGGQVDDAQTAAAQARAAAAEQPTGATDEQPGQDAMGVPQALKDSRSSSGDPPPPPPPKQEQQQLVPQLQARAFVADAGASGRRQPVVVYVQPLTGAAAAGAQPADFKQLQADTCAVKEAVEDLRSLAAVQSVQWAITNVAAANHFDFVTATGVVRNSAPLVKSVLLGWMQGRSHMLPRVLGDTSAFHDSLAAVLCELTGVSPSIEPSDSSYLDAGAPPKYVMHCPQRFANARR